MALATSSGPGRVVVGIGVVVSLLVVVVVVVVVVVTLIMQSGISSSVQPGAANFSSQPLS